MIYDVVIVGAGASGMMCAAALCRNKKLKVLILEKNDRLGKKILITGNGRCNLGNLDNDIKYYHSSSNLHSFKEALQKNKYNHIDFLKNIGILVLQEDNRLYPNSMQALTVCKSFERYLKNKVDIKYNYDVTSIGKKDSVYIINDEIQTKKLVIATGGKSYPKTGSTGIGYELLKKMGHKITKTYPSLTSLKTNDKYIKDLAGIRANVEVKLIVDNKNIDSQTGQLQFTKNSISGICVFNLSRNISKYLADGKKVSICIDLLPYFNDAYNYLKKFPDYKIQEALSCMINNKLAIVISKKTRSYDKLVSDISDNELKNICNMIKELSFNIIDTGSYDVAQVTNGGASLDEFNDDLESKKQKGLYAIGEILDVDADCGGYNLTWAFTSALIVANSILNN